MPLSCAFGVVLGVSGQRRAGMQLQGGDVAAFAAGPRKCRWAVPDLRLCNRVWISGESAVLIKNALKAPSG